MPITLYYDHPIILNYKNILLTNLVIIIKGTWHFLRSELSCAVDTWSHIRFLPLRSITHVRQLAILLDRLLIGPRFVRNRAYLHGPRTNIAHVFLLINPLLFVLLSISSNTVRIYLSFITFFFIFVTQNNNGFFVGLVPLWVTGEGNELYIGIGKVLLIELTFKSKRTMKIYRFQFGP